MPPSPQRLLLAQLVAPLALHAQCQDPPTPPQGFAQGELLDQVVTFGDGAKTMVDVTFPSAQPSACGWPLLVLVHGLGSSRKDLAWARGNYARAGYVTVCYDVRGHGDARALSAPEFGCALVGKEERLDLAEIVRWAGATLVSSPKVDLARVGVAGASQGGLHAWAAAAWSGKALPPNVRGIATFPTIKAAFPGLLPAMHEEVFVPGGTTVLNPLLTALWQGFGVRWDQAFVGSLTGAIAAESYGAVASAFASDPWRQDRAALATSTVATWVAVGWTDAWADAQQTLAALAALPPATPRHVHLDASTGHAVFPNQRQAELQRLSIERWAARFLKGVATGSEREARFQTCLPNVDPARDLDPFAPLWPRCYDAWPPADNILSRLYLRAQQTLAPAPPPAAEPADGPVVNAVPTGFDMAAYAPQAGAPGTQLFARIPLSSFHWDSAPLAEDLEVAGQPRVQLEVTTGDTTLLVHCVLLDVPPGASERYVTSGVLALRGAAAAPARLAVVMSPVQARFLAGHRVRLRAENAPWRRTSTQDGMLVAPCFAPFRIVIEHDAARPSFVELPVRPAVMPMLTLTDDNRLPLDGSRDVHYRIEAPAALAGQYFAAFWTASGTASVTPWPGSDPVRFTPDAVTSLLASSTYADWAGTLSPSGVGLPVLKLSALGALPPALSGLRISCAALVTRPLAQPSVVTSPVDFVLR